MLALLMIFAAVWGVLQLSVLGSFTRTVRIRSVLGAVAVGFYACATVSAGLQWLVTRAVAKLFGVGLEDVVFSAGFTIDPVIEEVVKVVPLLVAGWWFRSKSQWGVTDFVLMGSGFGAGFGLFEAFARVGQFLSKFRPFPGGGYYRLGSLNPPFIPGFSDIAGSWLPRSVTSPGIFGLGDSPSVAPHIVWSAVAGLGVGLFFKAKTRARVAALLLVLVSSFDHMAANYVVTKPGADTGRFEIYGGWLLDPFAGISETSESLWWLWGVVALVVAVGFDLNIIRRTRTDLAQHVTMAPTVTGRLAEKVSYAARKPMWTVPIVWQHTLTLRSASYGLHNDSTELAESLTADDQFILTTNNRNAWQDVTFKTVWARHRKMFLLGWRHVALVGLWLLLLAPSILYFIAGGNPKSQIQQQLASTWGLRITLGVMIVGLVWVGWQTRTWYQTLRQSLGHPSNTLVITAFHRLLVSVSTIIIGLALLNVRRLADHSNPAQQTIISNNHVLTALAALLLIAAIALLIAAIILFPPSIAVLSVAGTGLAVPIVSVSGGFLGFTAAAATATAGSAYAYDQSQQARTQPDQTTSNNDYNTANAESTPFPNDDRWTVGGPKPETPLAPEIQEIAEHGWTQGHTDNIPEADSVEDMQEIVQETVENATEWGSRTDGSTYWYDEVTDRLVIKNPNGRGTVYNPDNTGSHLD